MPRLNRSARRCLALVVGLFLALLVAPDGLAQSGVLSVLSFAGQWQSTWRVQPPAPTIVLDVTLRDGQVLIVDERSPDRGWRRPTVHYRLDPLQATGTADRTFRWLAPDRLEVHDFLISARAGRTAVTDVWVLLDGGRTLRIQRTLQVLDDLTTPAETHVYTYRRMDP